MHTPQRVSTCGRPPYCMMCYIRFRGTDPAWMTEIGEHSGFQVTKQHLRCAALTSSSVDPRNWARSSCTAMPTQGLRQSCKPAKLSGTLDIRIASSHCALRVSAPVSVPHWPPTQLVATHGTEAILRSAHPVKEQSEARHPVPSQGEEAHRQEHLHKGVHIVPWLTNWR